MKLIHMTRPEYVENIKSKGLLLSEKIKIYKQQPYIKADQMIDAYTGPSRRGKEWMKQSGHYCAEERIKIKEICNCFVCTGGMIYSHLIFISKTGR